MNADGEIPVYFDFFPGQGMAMFRVTPILKRRWFRTAIRVDFAISLCSPRDEFDFEVGKNLALDRLDAYIDGRKNLRERGLAGTWTMRLEDWQKVAIARREQEYLLETMTNNFNVERPWGWEKVIQ